MMHDWTGWSGGMFFGSLLMILLWVFVVLGILALARWLYTQGSGSSRKPLDILKERYARGEISREQYEQMRRDVES